VRHQQIKDETDWMDIDVVTEMLEHIPDDELMAGQDVPSDVQIVEQLCLHT
jgi:hypothetical protein